MDGLTNFIIALTGLTTAFAGLVAAFLQLRMLGKKVDANHADTVGKLEQNNSKLDETNVKLEENKVKIDKLSESVGDGQLQCPDPDVYRG